MTPVNILKTKNKTAEFYIRLSDGSYISLHRTNSHSTKYQLKAVPTLELATRFKHADPRLMYTRAIGDSTRITCVVTTTVEVEFDFTPR
jgi:hypothetical protein